MAKTVNVPRERVFQALTGGRPDRTPFVIWDNKIPDPATLSALLEREACVTVKSAAYTTTLEGITTERESFTGADGAPGDHDQLPAGLRPVHGASPATEVFPGQRHGRTGRGGAMSCASCAPGE